LVNPREARAVHTPESGDDSAPYCRLGLIFLLYVFVYSFVSMYSLSMYDSSFIVIFHCKGGLIVILVRFEILSRQLFF
jgi:hypothetical protein